MPPTVEQLKEQLGALPATDRAELAHFLLQTLDGEEEQDVDQAWIAVAKQRLAEIERGQARVVSAEDFLTKLRAKYP